MVEGRPAQIIESTPMKLSQESKNLPSEAQSTGSQNSMSSAKRFSLSHIEPRKVISLAILFLFLLWIILYIRNHISEFNNIFDLSLRVVTIISMLLLADSVILGLFNKILMQDFDISLQFKEWYGLSLVSNLWNYILPFQGGGQVSGPFI